jgi:hypothetical protein
MNSSWQTAHQWIRILSSYLTAPCSRVPVRITMTVSDGPDDCRSNLSNTVYQSVLRALRLWLYRRLCDQMSSHSARELPMRFATRAAVAEIYLAKYSIGSPARDWKHLDWASRYQSIPPPEAPRSFSIHKIYFNCYNLVITYSSPPSPLTVNCAVNQCPNS